MGIEAILVECRGGRRDSDGGAGLLIGTRAG